MHGALHHRGIVLDAFAYIILKHIQNADNTPTFTWETSLFTQFCPGIYHESLVATTIPVNQPHMTLTAYENFNKWYETSKSTSYPPRWHTLEVHLLVSLNLLLLVLGSWTLVQPIVFVIFFLLILLTICILSLVSIVYKHKLFALTLPNTSHHVAYCSLYSSCL